MNIGIISASSDIGHALAMHWQAKGWKVAGTYRTPSAKTADLEAAGIALVPCDLDEPSSVTTACARLVELAAPWDALVICPGTLEPLGDFAACAFEDWSISIQRNFLSQMQCIHALLPSRRRDGPNCPTVICWAGGGTNGAPKSVSAYTVSKIAQIKMLELLDAEIPDVSFVTLGPGWVKTKIHDEVIKAGSRAGDAYDATVRQLSGAGARQWTEMSRVLACCDWVISSERRVVSGRNFSIAHDPWEDANLTTALTNNPDMYKLRRHNNNWRQEP